MSAVFGSAGGCCGGCDNSYNLYPDFYFSSQIRSFRTVTNNTQLDVRTLTETRVWVNGVATTTVDDVTTTITADPIVTQSVDNAIAFGTFSHTYNVIDVLVDSGFNITDGDQTSGNYTEVRTRLWRTLTGNLTIRRRLAVQYDVSDQFNFGRINGTGGNVIYSAHLRADLDSHLDPMFNAIIPLQQNGTPAETLADDRFFVGGTMKGFIADTPLPSTIQEFDTQYAASSNAISLTNTLDTNQVPHNVKTWLPTTSASTITVYFDSTSRGAELSDLKLSISDRQLPISDGPSGIEGEYNWRKFWERVDHQQWIAKRKTPKSEYEVLLSRLANRFFDDPQADLRIEIGSFNETTGNWQNEYSARQFHQIEVGPVVASPQLYDWTVRIDGTLPESLHRQASIQPSAISQTTQALFPVNMGLRVRHSLIEMVAIGWRFENGIRNDYQSFPKFLEPSEEPDKKLQVRITARSAFATAPSVAFNTIRDQLHDRNRKCADTNCIDFHPYAHLQWRVEDLDVPDNRDIEPLSNYAHDACNTQFQSLPSKTQLNGLLIRKALPPATTAFSLNAVHEFRFELQSPIPAPFAYTASIETRRLGQPNGVEIRDLSNLVGLRDGVFSTTIGRFSGVVLVWKLDYVTLSPTPHPVTGSWQWEWTYEYYGQTEIPTLTSRSTTQENSTAAQYNAILWYRLDDPNDNDHNRYLSTTGQVSDSLPTVVSDHVKVVLRVELNVQVSLTFFHQRRGQTGLRNYDPYDPNTGYRLIGRPDGNGNTVWFTIYEDGIIRGYVMDPSEYSIRTEGYMSALYFDHPNPNTDTAILGFTFPYNVPNPSSIMTVVGTERRRNALLNINTIPFSLLYTRIVPNNTDPFSEQIRFTSQDRVGPFADKFWYLDTLNANTPIEIDRNGTRFSPVAQPMTDGNFDDFVWDVKVEPIDLA